MATATKSRISKNGTELADALQASIPADHEVVHIPKPNLKTFTVTLKGLTPMIQHKFSEKAIGAIKAKQGHEAVGPKGKRDPNAEYLAACYVFPGHKAGEKGCSTASPSRRSKHRLLRHAGSSTGSL